MLTGQGFERQLLDCIPDATYRLFPTMKQSKRLMQKGQQLVSLALREIAQIFTEGSVV